MVADLEEAVEALTGQQVTVTAIEDRPWGRFAWFSVPDGNGWELNQVG